MMKRLFNKKSSATTTATATAPETSSTPPPQQPPPPSTFDQRVHDAQNQTSQQGPDAPYPAQGPGGQGDFVPVPIGPQAYAIQMVPQLVPVVMRPPRVRDVINAIGWSCAAPQFDFTYVLALADHIGFSTAASKDAAKALRKEFKHAVPSAQERAVRLTGILARNADLRFRKEVASKKFLAELENLATSRSTEPPVKQMVLRVLSPLAYEYARDADLKPITALYNKIRPDGTPLNGEPLNPEDDLFTPTADPRMQSSRRNHQSRRGEPHRMPSMGDQMKDLRSQSEQARGYARMLNEAVAFAKEDEDLKSNEIVQEFHAQCFGAQDYLTQNLQWATVQAEQSRVAADQALAEAPPAEEFPTTMNETRNEHRFSSNNPFAPIVSSPPRSQSTPRRTAEETDEEKTFATLLAAHTEVIEALKLYDDHQHRLLEHYQVQEAEARSRIETRFDRANAGTPDRNGDYHLEVDERDHTRGDGASGSGSGDEMSSAVGEFQQDESSKRESRNPYAAYLSSPPRNNNAGYLIPDSATTTNSKTHDSSADEEHTERSYGQVDLHDLDPFASETAQGSSTTTRPRVDTRASVDSTDAVPLAPSEKALGKLRSVSGRDDSPTDYAEQQNRLEEQLRSKYSLQYEEEKAFMRSREGL
ncbi:BZ3500_MvSof-1268-A1-R1_Chr12-3g04002 [Microbotryum saponariae]|uniref:BZ3500_MvSof-1268-A1-R1_Chr12-3g04002 protein n=1 Tax=Microbotryum saponariae TaxID=289078 RepID=A0A2X0LT98_9BASI|nr:BZ3500_MvSof-1268-A1-R1_Chr12-3g04002 [Microbotryum saponariae]SDA02513.1 BZ3501_MvSof-1269-A2-R1_Chr12-3g03657 [Microbotryum saponariae]